MLEPTQYTKIEGYDGTYLTMLLQRKKRILHTQGCYGKKSPKLST